MNNPFPFALANKRYHTLDYALKIRFGSKLAKVPLHGGFTCPNRDGTIEIGGCTFCSATGASDYLLEPSTPLIQQYEYGKNIALRKWKTNRFIAFFQAYTNTHAPLTELRKRFDPLLEWPDVAMIAIATRPDCLPNDVIHYLSELNRVKPLWIELGLQTIFDETAQSIHRGYDLSVFIEAVQRLRQHNLEVVVHIINGLPGESHSMMIQTAAFLSQQDIQGIKFHALTIAKQSALGVLYQQQPFPLLTQTEYLDVLIKQLELLPPSMIIHRINGDPVEKELLGPMWCLNKRHFSNQLDREMVIRNTFQGRCYHEY
jgi:radical SAM protein (TIGR01212 family)